MAGIYPEGHEETTGVLYTGERRHPVHVSHDSSCRAKHGFEVADLVDVWEESWTLPQCLT